MTPYSSMAYPANPYGQADHAQETEQAVSSELRELERHGERSAQNANRLATMLVGVFSVASLLSLSLEAWNKFASELVHGRLDLNDLLSVILNILIVLAMDMAMFYAATVIRSVLNAGGKARHAWLHILIMVTACILESSTYIYLVVTYDKPTNPWLWAIGIGRAVAAPLFSVYLALARKLPVAPTDIAYYVALFAGKGVIHDVALLAADKSAPLARKVAIYTAAATMKPADFMRFSNIIAAVTPRIIPEDKRQEQPKPVEPAAPETPQPQQAPAQLPQHAPDRTERKPERTEKTQLAPAAAKPAAKPAAKRPKKVVSAPLNRTTLRQRREEAARRILADTPALSNADLARAIAIATSAKCSPGTASNVRKAIVTQRESQREDERRKVAGFRIIERNPGDVEDDAGDEEAQEQQAQLLEN